MTTTFLLNDFYTIKSTELIDENKLLAEVFLNKSHDIFKGHFEQMPVVPGVCQTQMIKEILQLHLKKDLLLHKGDNIKFLAMIIPTQVETILVELNFKNELDNYQVDAKLFSESTIFTKFKGTFTSI